MYSSPATSRPATPQAIRARGERLDSSEAVPQCRLMQVKVLYTFDDNNKSNCLARCPQPLQIRTAMLDISSEIGIIELRACVQAIVAASPELIAKLGQDYTVYAYDYSEYEIPLVGQGMLSWVLASASTTPTAPAHQSRTMVTGRVCKNILGLFADGIKETLEVKLRLVPVPTCLQSEYLASMAKYRDASNLAAEGIDVDAWTTFLRANPGFANTTPAFDSSSLSTTQQQSYSTTSASATDDTSHTYRLDDTFDGPRDSIQPRKRSIGGELSTHQTRDDQEMDLRPSTPIKQSQNRRRAPSRPSSRTSARGKQNARPKPPSRTESQQESEATVVEEGPTRKRARPTKADWRGPSTFAPHLGSLRVTASTAASIRGHSVPKAHPSASDLAAGDFANRPPTPRPPPAAQRKEPGKGQQYTLLSSDTTHKMSDDYTSPYPKDAGHFMLTSPDGVASSVDSTPPNMPSSPPIPRPRSRSPFSPSLPKFPDELDSGYASGPLGENIVDDDDGIRSYEEDRMHTTSHYRAHTVSFTSGVPVTEAIPGDRDTPRWGVLPKAQQQASFIRSEAESPQHSNELNTVILEDQAQGEPCNRETFNGSSTEKQSPSPCETPPPLLLQRCESWTSESVLISDTPAPVGQVKLLGSKQTTGTSLKRKKAIQDRLHSSIAAGEMPPFCRNCGEISTPTWRKAFARVEDGSPDGIVEHDDGFVMCEPLSKGENGMTISFRIIRKSVGAEDKDFEEIQLCNPCGIWLFKNRSMRPPEKWTKFTVETSKSRRKSSKKPSTTTNAEAQPGFGSDPQSLGESESNIEPADALTRYQHQQTRSSSIVRNIRAVSLGAGRSSETSHLLEEGAAMAALQKAIQSSPPRFPGSKQSPIDLDADLSPQPTRRLLFPSPRRPGETKILNGPSLESPKRSGNGGFGKTPFTEFVQEDKENNPPVEAGDEDPTNLIFEASEPSCSPRTPKSAPSPSSALRTPSTSAKRRVLGFNPFLSPSRRPVSAPVTPSRMLTSEVTEHMTPFTAQLTQLISEANLPMASGMGGLDMFSDDLGDVSEMFGFHGLVDCDEEGVGIEESFSFYEDATPSGTEPREKELLATSIEAFLDVEKAPGEIEVAVHTSGN